MFSQQRATAVFPFSNFFSTWLRRNQNLEVQYRSQKLVYDTIEVANDIYISRAIYRAIF